MARSDIPTLMALDQWAEVMGFNPWEFNQIGLGVPFGRDRQCPTVWYQYSWQKQFLSRTEIALAISKAEEALAELLNFYPAYNPDTEWQMSYPNDWRLSMRSGLTPRGQYKPVSLRWKHLDQLGTRTLALIAADQTVTFSDADGDGVEDTFTLTVATEISADEIEVYYPAAIRHVLDDTWRIRPLQITQNSAGTEITIVGAKYLLVDPINYEKPAPEKLNATDASIFFTEIDVYRSYIDSSNIGTVEYDARVGFTGDRTFTLTEGRVVNNRLAVIRPKVGLYTYGAVDPDRVTICYASGPRMRQGKVPQPFASMIAYLATHYLPALACGCDRADQILYFWRSSPADSEQAERPMTSEEINENPLGATRGAIYAYQMVQTKLVPLGVSV